MALQTFYLPHVPPDMPIHVALYQDVRNAAFLKQQLLSGNEEFEYAFIDATVILSRVHALAAVYRALNDHLQGRRKSRNVHAEIVFALSPNNNIAESFRRFGISEATKSLLVIKVSTTPSISHESVQRHLDAVIEGAAVEFSDESFLVMTDPPRVRKLYKLTEGPRRKRETDGDAANAGLPAAETELAILGAIALRGAS